MALWTKILTEASVVKDRTLNVTLGQVSTTGMKPGCVNFLRPITVGKAVGSSEFPSLEFSDNFFQQAFDNKAIKNFNKGQDLTGSDTATAKFDLVGDMSMDSAGNGRLAESLMGCAFPVPMGSTDVGYHDVELDFKASHEGGSGEASFLGQYKITVWRAYAGDGVTLGAGAPDTLEFRLVYGGFDGVLQTGALAGFGDEEVGVYFMYLNNAYPNDMSAIRYVRLRFPVVGNGDDWKGQTCYYMVGFHNLHPLINSAWYRPDVNSLQFPSTAHPVSGNKQCSITANFRVTYRAN